MKPLRVFSSNLELLAEIDDYESLVITRKWHTYGEIDLVIHQDKRHVDKLINGNILLPGNDVKSAAVIRHRESDLDTLKIKSPTFGVIHGTKSNSSYRNNWSCRNRDEATGG